MDFIDLWHVGRQFWTKKRCQNAFGGNFDHRKGVQTRLGAIFINQTVLWHVLEQFLSSKPFQNTFGGNFYRRNRFETRFSTILNENSSFDPFGSRFSTILNENSSILWIWTPPNDKLSLFIVRIVVNLGFIDSEHLKSDFLSFGPFLIDKIIQCPMKTVSDSYQPGYMVYQSIDMGYRPSWYGIQTRSANKNKPPIDWVTHSWRLSIRGVIWTFESILRSDFRCDWVTRRDYTYKLLNPDQDPNGSRL